MAGVRNSFDHMDLKRASVLDSKCKGGPGGGECPPVFLASEANGWLNSNSLHYVPATGDFVVSARSELGRAIETSADGKVLYGQQIESTAYRTFRVQSLYSAPAKQASDYGSFSSHPRQAR